MGHKEKISTCATEYTNEITSAIRNDIELADRINVTSDFSKYREGLLKILENADKKKQSNDCMRLVFLANILLNASNNNDHLHQLLEIDKVDVLPTPEKFGVRLYYCAKNQDNLKLETILSVIKSYKVIPEVTYTAKLTFEDFKNDLSCATEKTLIFVGHGSATSKKLSLELKDSASTFKISSTSFLEYCNLDKHQNIIFCNCGNDDFVIELGANPKSDLNLVSFNNFMYQHSIIFAIECYFFHLFKIGNLPALNILYLYYLVFSTRFRIIESEEERNFLPFGVVVLNDITENYPKIGFEQGTFIAL